MAAREIFGRGSRWVVGNGEKVSIWNDQWLPTLEAFKVVSPKPPQDEAEIVAELIDLDRQSWDVAKIKRMFLPHEANVILGSPLSPRLLRDSLIWAWTPKGMFTINSAYKVAQSLLREAYPKLERGECSDTAGMKSLWKPIWGLNCPNKVRMFIWKACSNILPNKHQLWARGIGRDDVCDLCEGCESSGHILWGCKVAREVWSNTRLKLPMLEVIPRDFVDIV